MSDIGSPPKRRGRPPLSPEDRKDGNLTFRTRGDLRQRLNESAEANGLTVSQEVERRLEASFQAESEPASAGAQYFENLKILFGGNEGFSEAVELGMYWRRIKDAFFLRHSGLGNWYENEDNLKLTEENFTSGVRRILLGFAGRAKREAEGREGR